MPYLKVWFYDPSDDDEGMLNHLVARLDGPYCHCEVQFSDQSACTVYMNSPIIFKARTFDKQMYSCVVLSCTSAQEIKAKDFIHQQMRANVRFSTLAMSLAMMPSVMPYMGRGTFCSKLCADVLIECGLLEAGVQTGKLSPSALHRLIATVTPKLPVTSKPLDFCEKLASNQSVNL